MTISQAHPVKNAVVFGASGGIGTAFVEALLARGAERVFAGSRNGAGPSDERVTPFAFDLPDEGSIAAAARAIDVAPDLVLVATGVLTTENGRGPEKTIRALDPATMADVLAANTIGPAMIAKHFLPKMPRNRRSVFAALSARVGSISDNRLGGWHSYRASKAALNMLIRNFAIELGRTHKQAIVAGLHPGTVDTKLSEPFQGNVPDGKLFDAAFSANAMLDVIDALGPADSGKIHAWDGQVVPY